jgi:uncharacterized protein YciI
MNLFDLSNEFIALQTLLLEAQSPEDIKAVNELYSEIGAKLSEKLESTAYIVKGIESDVKMLSDEIKRLQARKKSLENKAKYLKELAKDALVASGDFKLKTPKFTFSVSVRKEIDYTKLDTQSLGDDYFRVKRELDKTKLKEAVKNGDIEVPTVAKEIFSIR